MLLLLFFFRICGPTIHVSKHWRKVWTGWSRKQQVGVLLDFFFSPLFHYGKHQCCIHVSAVCFSNVCSNRRSTSSLAFVALAAFKNKCPVTVRRGRRSSNLFLQSSLCVCDGKAKSIILQDGTRIRSAR